MIAALRLRFPLWSRIAGAALLASFILGQVLAIQPPGPITAAIVQAASMTCPAALPSSREIQIGDAARTLDRMVLIRMLEEIDGRSGCGRKIAAG